ncbi:MAG: type II secretion system protein [Candidatus Saccharimonadales bacterium]
MKTPKQSGFTVVELIVVILTILLSAWLFTTQKLQFEAASRDRERKIAINAMYYSLEEVYFRANKSYPVSIGPNNLKSVDPSLFKDPNGVEVGKQSSDYFYTPINCDGNLCKSFVLRAKLEQEAEYKRNSVN